MPLHSSPERARRQHDNGEEDHALPTLISRVEDPQTEGYRPHSYNSRHTDRQKPSSSGRASFNMNRESTSFRHEPSHSAHDRYDHVHSSDTYHRGARDDYEISDSRDTNPRSNRAKNDSHRISGREHSSNYEKKSSGQYYESNSWSNSGDGGDSWPPPPRRGGDAADDRGQASELDDRHDKDSYSHGRPREQRRGFDSRNVRSDNGWESRRQDRNQGQGHSDSRRPQGGRDDHQLSSDDRSWEPNPSWQRGGHQGRGQGNSRNGGSNKNNKGKKNQNKHQQRRERQVDEDNLNNWQRRDTGYSSKKSQPSPVKRRPIHSRSRSRSRSPDSHYSRRSSRGRSRSRSLSPRRQHQDSSLIRARSRTPSDRGRSTWRYHDRGNSRSPASSHYGRDRRGGPRRRSISSASTSRSRSSSRSPADRPRAKHRLPPATSIKEISLSISKTSLQQRSNMLQSRDAESRRNGRGQANGKPGNRNRANSPHNDWSSGGAMPPPPMVPMSSTSQAPPSPSASVRSATLSEPSGEANTPRARPVTLARAGFKPIGQPSSAVKRFFPGDDDDEIDHVPPRKSPVMTTPRVESSHFGRYMREDNGVDRQFNAPSGSVTEPISFRKPSSSQPFSPLPAPSRDIGAESHRSIHYSPAAHRPQSQPTVPKVFDSHEGGVKMQQLQTQHPDADEPPFPSTPPAQTHRELYTIVSQVGEGTFGKVYKARNNVSNVHVALKRIRMEAERDGFPVTAMREIKLLQSLRHQNIVRLYEMMVSNGSVFMVFEYMDHDLTGVLSQTQFSFSEANLKSLCSQMLSGLAYLHHKGVIHRDIKGSNILLNNRGELKLADFGLARFYQKRRRSDYTNRVITLWYRPPELLFGATVYGPEVDMWSAGCIMLELYTKKPVFQGNDEIHQLDVIYKILGTPTPARWPGVTELPWYELVKPKEVIPDHFRELFQRWMSPAALDLAEQLLGYDPGKRVSAVQALDAPYFNEDPRPELPVGLSTLEGEWHELETKRERAKKRRKLETGPQ